MRHHPATQARVTSYHDGTHGCPVMALFIVHNIYHDFMWTCSLQINVLIICSLFLLSFSMRVKRNLMTATAWFTDDKTFETELMNCISGLKQMSIPVSGLEYIYMRKSVTEQELSYVTKQKFPTGLSQQIRPNN